MRSHEFAFRRIFAEYIQKVKLRKRVALREVVDFAFIKDEFSKILQSLRAMYSDEIVGRKLYKKVRTLGYSVRTKMNIYTSPV